jgi:hypothetical protein
MMMSSKLSHPELVEGSAPGNCSDSAEMVVIFRELILRHAQDDGFGVKFFSLTRFSGSPT